ncbi:MAG: DUF3784 domain-containing protein [Clostridiales bacterium]|nr:DUF3784 domain-containing protein [Clostridiales bacterium]
METATIISAVLFSVMAAGAFVIACFQFRGKGFLFNNAYIYASQEERRRMDKKPYYRQSGVAFCLMGVLFCLVALECIANAAWLIYIILLVCLLAIVYAVVSSIKIEKRRK